MTDSKKDAPKEEEMPELENQGDDQAFNRGEKKCRKALIKAGMKQLTGITRVTLKKRDGLIFVIDDPEVLNLDNSYAIFGELKLEDLNKQMQMEQAKKFAAKAPATKATGASVKEESDGEALPAGDLTESNITMVMDHANVSRNKAIRALKGTNDDMVQAVMALTK